MNFISYIKNPGKILCVLSSKKRFGFRLPLPDKLFLKWMFKAAIGKKLDLVNPRTFNQKLQWLKLYDRNPKYTKLVDKYEVKEYIKGLIGEEYVIPTIGVWDKFDDIDFDKLPMQFVIKCTHDSGGVVIVKDKEHFDRRKARKKIEKSLKQNFYYCTREWPYKNVKPRIIIEKYMDSEGHEDLNDYKLMCFNGMVKCSFTCTERYSCDGLKVTFFDNEWNVMPFERHYPKSKKNIIKPAQFEQMKALAELLSKEIPFLRVDFYEINGKIYFGELTFYPGAGFEEFTPEEWDYNLGKWLKLPR